MSETYDEPIPYGEISIDDHLSLRQLRVDEADNLFKLVDKNRKYLAEWLPWVGSTISPDDSKAFISDTLQKRLDGSEYGYGIIVDGNPVGHISLMHINDNSTPEIGYWISSQMSGRGITTKAAEAITNFGFNTLSLDKIVIKADPENTASNKIAEKLGYSLAEQEYDDRIGTANVWALERS